MKAQRLRAFALATVIAVVAGHVCAFAQTTVETKLKAAIVSKFPQFVEWPPAALADGAAVTICMVGGGDPMQKDLEDLVAGEALENHPYAVRTVDREADVDGCHVLFAAAAAVASHRPLLRRAAALPVLTVSDDPGFLDNGGIVRLRSVSGRMRFDVNAGAAQRVGLRISSQLLQLAMTVRDGPA
jgi:hypothetical protein